MTRSRRLWNPRVLGFALVAGLTIFLVAVGVQFLFPQWPRARHGAIVVGWMIFCICLVPLVNRRTRDDSRS